MLFKLSNLNSNLALTLGYLNPALNNSALSSWVENEVFSPGRHMRCSRDLLTQGRETFLIKWLRKSCHWWAGYPSLQIDRWFILIKIAAKSGIRLFVTIIKSNKNMRKNIRKIAPPLPHGFQVRHRLSFCATVYLKVDFQCFYVHTHVNSTRVNKIETGQV